MPLELRHEYLHPLNAEAFRFKERQDEEVHIIVTYGPIGCKGSDGATGLSVVLHPVQFGLVYLQTQLLPCTRSGRLSCQMAAAK